MFSKYRRLIGSLTMLFALNSLANAQLPPTAPATSTGTYTVSFLFEGQFTSLMERVGPNGQWQYIDLGMVYHVGNNVMNATFTNKPPGEYFYRVEVNWTNEYGESWTTWTNEVVRVLVSGGSQTPPPQVDTLTNQRTYTYETRRGDINGDGQLDLYVNRTSGGQAGNGALGNFILQRLANGTFSVINPNAAQAATASTWGAVSVSTTLEDINYDGFADMVLGKLYEVIPGSIDQVVYASAQTYVNAPKGVKAVDATFRKFLGDLTKWIAQPKYFENTAPVVQVPVYAYGVQCDWYYDYEYGWYEYCYPVVIYYGYYLAYDFSGFSQPAVQFKRTFDEVGEGPLGDTRAGVIKQILDGALGVPTGLGITVPVDDVIWIPWPDTRGDRSPWLGRFLFRLNLILTIAQLSGDTPNFTYYHYTTAEGTAGILLSGSILSSTGLVYMTQTLYGSGQQALMLLALPTTPTNAFILMSKEMGPPMPVYVGVVQPRYGQPGGGQEWTKLAPVPIGLTPRVIRLAP
jgi:hypothetical protein